MFFIRTAWWLLMGIHQLMVNWQVQEDNRCVARVGKQRLYLSQLKEAGVHLEGSSEEKAHFIQQWLEKQWLIQAIKKRGGYNQAHIAEKLLAYKYALITHDYITRQVDARLDTTITPEDIKSYYDKHAYNFELKYSIAKGRVLVLPRTEKKQGQLYNWLVAKDEVAASQLAAYCQEQKIHCILSDEVWLPFSTFVKGTPFEKVPDSIRFLREVKRLPFFRQSDAQHIYYMIVRDYKVAHERSPLDFVSSQIRQILLHQRRLILAQQIEQELIQDEKKYSKYEISLPEQV